MNLKEIREHLDRIDNTLLFLLAERMSFIPKVAEYKKRNNIQRYQPEREKQIISSKKKLASENKLNPDFIEKIFKELISEAHKIERNIIGK
jgi:chorismate mutase-like protein